MYKPTDQDRTPEGLKNLLKNYHVMATFMGGIIAGKRSDSSTQVYKVENFFVEGVNSTEDMENCLRSEVFGSPYGIYLELRHIKKAPAVIFNMFTEDEQRRLKESNLPEEAIQLMKEACFDIADKHKGLGTEPMKQGEDTEDPDSIPNQEEYDKYYKQYDEMNRPEVAELIQSEEFADKLKTNAMFTAKAELIRFYILYKHKIKPEFTGA